MNFNVITVSVLEIRAIERTASLQTQGAYKLKEPLSTMVGRPMSPHRDRDSVLASAMPSVGVGTE